VGKYVVFFQSTDDELMIVRIIHGSRDIESVFRETGAE
jgi:plasmid stabilization system protein ParE